MENSEEELKAAFDRGARTARDMMVLPFRAYLNMEPNSDFRPLIELMMRMPLPEYKQ